MQKLANANAKVLEQTLEAADPNIQKIIIATHIPPFQECCFA
jgi:hypothetical protein